MTDPRIAAEAFALPQRIVAVQPLGHGLINDTFLVRLEAPGQGHAVLQRLNRKAFPRPELVMENLRTLLAHAEQRALRDPARRGLRLPAILRTRDGIDWFIDAEGGFWRALSYLDNTRAIERLRNPHEAAEVGMALGRFHELTRDLDSRRLHVTRPGFHDTPGYLTRYAEVLDNNKSAIDDATLRYCLEFVEARKGIAGTFAEAAMRGELAPRVIHGDPKLDNVLFDEASDEAVSLIDLDTVQPGLLHYDLGDCLRSCCNPLGESPLEPSAVHFDLDLCRAILAGYFAEMGRFLTDTDRRYLPDAARLIAFELGVRFLTDHLEGDRYFKVQVRGHNLRRAATQFHLVESIEAQRGAIDALISGLPGK